MLIFRLHNEKEENILKVFFKLKFNVNKRSKHILKIIKMAEKRLY